MDSFIIVDVAKDDIGSMAVEEFDCRSADPRGAAFISCCTQRYQ